MDVVNNNHIFKLPSRKLKLSFLLYMAVQYECCIVGKTRLKIFSKDEDKVDSESWISCYPANYSSFT